MFLREFQDSVKLMMLRTLLLFTGLIPLIILVKSSVPWCLTGSWISLYIYHPLILIRVYTRSHIVYTTIVSFQMNIEYQRKIKNRKKKIVLDRSWTEIRICCKLMPFKCWFLNKRHVGISKKQPSEEFCEKICP